MRNFFNWFLHKSHYYYNDFKTDNFIKLKEGSISLIDLDSFRYVYPLEIPNFCYIPKYNFNIIKYYVKETTTIGKCGKYKHCSKYIWYLVNGINDNVYKFLQIFIENLNIDVLYFLFHTYR